MKSALLSSKNTVWLGGLAAFMLCLFGAFLLDQFILLAFPFAALFGLAYFADIRIGFWALIGLIPWSFNAEELIKVSIDFPSEPLMLVLTLTALLWVGFQAKKLPLRQLAGNPIVLLIFFSFLWTGITVIYSENPALSIKFLLKKIWFLTPFFILPLFVFSQPGAIQKTARFLIWPLCLVVLLITWRFSALGFRFEAVHNPLQPFFMNHVMYGSMVSIALPIAVCGVWMTKRWSLPWFLALAATGILVIAVYLAYSRAAWAAVFFALGAVVLVRFRLMHWAMMVFYGVLLSAVLYLSNHNHFLNYKPKFEKTIMHESLEDHIMATIQGTDISSAERYFRWIAALRMSGDRPITGVGPNNFYDYYKAYVVNSFKTWVSRNPEKSTTHNYYLYMLVEQGYPAMLLYAILMVVVYAYAQKVFRRLKGNRQARLMVLGAVGVIAATFINNFFSELLEADKIGSLFYMALATLVVLDPSMGILRNEPADSSTEAVGN